MYIPGYALLGMMFYVLREAIARDEEIELIYLELKIHLLLYNLELTPSLSRTMSLTEYDTHLPIWKERFIELAATDSDPIRYKMLMIGFEIGLLHTLLIGKTSSSDDLSVFDYRRAIRSRETITRLESLCIECGKSIEVREILEATAKQINAAKSMADLETIAHMIEDWHLNPAMQGTAWSFK